MNPIPPRTKTDVLVIGSGAAGLAVALHLAREHNVLVVSKERIGDGSTNWMEGGVAAVSDPQDSLTRMSLTRYAQELGYAPHL